MNDIIANSDHKHPLTDHLLGVSKLAVAAAQHLCLPECVVEMCGVAGLLHDIGKAAPEFQSFVRGDGPWVSHNELSWVFSKIFSTGKMMNPIYQAIYWHHGTPFSSKELEERTHTLLWDKQSEGSKTSLKEVFTELNKKSPIDLSKYICTDDVDDFETGVECPNLFEKLDKGLNNATMLAIRGCLLFADRHISKQSTDDLHKFLSGKITHKRFLQKRKKRTYNLTCPNEYNKARFKKQSDVLKSCGKTTVVRGPAGFGKTVVGLMWALNQEDQIYWVTPRNSVAEMVYDNIISELKVFGIKASVELYLTGDQKRSHGNVSGPCSANIVVTNIDNLLSPMVSDKDADRLFLVQAATVVFDEFHEFLTDEAFFLLPKMNWIYSVEE